MDEGKDAPLVEVGEAGGLGSEEDRVDVLPHGGVKVRHDLLVARLAGVCGEAGMEEGG